MLKPQTAMMLMGIFFLSIMLFIVVNDRMKINSLHRYTQIQPGMSTEEMLRIMGDGYQLSTLKNGRKKYTWKHKLPHNTMSVSITTLNGIVEEIRPNL